MIGQRIGSYRLTRVLGEGGMGVVYEAVHEGIGGRAAIKVLKPEYALSADVAARFFNEARAANLVEHPGIVKVFDYGQLPQGVAFLAMEFLEGETLFIRLQRERRLSEADTVRIGRQMAAALAAAHAKQVIHRDLKPDNVFIVADAEVDNGERVKLLDFGIAKIAAQNGVLRTGTNMLLGTPVYMSPEQCRGSKSIGDRTDVYSLGVMLYEMVSGRTPFLGEDPGEYIGQHIYGDVPPLGALVPSLTPALSRLIESMLIKEPQSRPSMAAVARVLKELGQFSSDVLPMRALLEADSEPLAGEDKRPEPSPSDEDPTRSVAVKAPRQVLPALPASPPPPPAAASDAKSDAKSDAGPARCLDAVPDAVPDKPAAMTDSTRLLAANVVPVPTPTPTPTQAPGWQTINVVAGQEPTEMRNARATDEALDRPRPASLVRSLRRLQLRLKRFVYGVLGLPLSQPGSSQLAPAASLTERSKKILLGVAVVVIVAPILALILRPSTDSSDPPAEIEQRLPTDPSLDLAARKRGPSGAPLPSGLPAEVQRGLDEAQRQAEGGSAAAAWKTLRAVVKKTDHAAAWLELGRYACSQRSPKPADEARDHLAVVHDASGAEELIGFCQKHGVVVGADGRLMLDGPARPGDHSGDHKGE